MDKRILGKTGFEASVIGFGGGAVSGEAGGYGFGAMTAVDAHTLIKKCFEKGINIYDSAPVYGFGESERRIGQALHSVRDQVFFISKSGVTWTDQKRIYKSNDPEQTQQMLEQSLRDLATDWIDLYMIHWPDEMVDIRRPMEVLARAKQQGKIKHIGLCNSYPADIQAAMEIATVDVLQNEFNLFQHDLVDEELSPLIKQNQMGFIGYGTLDKGILTGRVTRSRTFDRFDARSRAPWWKKADRNPKYHAMNRLEPILKDHGHQGIDMALSFVLDHSYLSSALCGIRNLDQLYSATAALDHRLDTALSKQVYDIIRETLLAP